MSGGKKDGGGISLTGDWKIIGPTLTQMAVVIPGIMERAVMQEALKYEREMKERIVSQAVVPPRLSRLTLQLRALGKSAGTFRGGDSSGSGGVSGGGGGGFLGTKALIVSGALNRSNKAQKVEDKGRRGFKIFVGVNRKARARRAGGGWGGKLVNVAMVQEFGSKPFYIKVTTKLRKFWMFLYMRGIVSAPIKASTTMLGPFKIPPRAWVGPTYEANRAESPKRIQERMFREFRALVSRRGGKTK